MINPIDKQEIIETLTNLIEDEEFKYALKRSPRSKRNSKHTIRFWKSVKHHLSNG